MHLHSVAAPEDERDRVEIVLLCQEECIIPIRGSSRMGGEGAEQALRWVFLDECHPNLDGSRLDHGIKRG